MSSSATVVVSGGAGQIGYSLLYRIASGEMLGASCSVHLRILEIPPMLDRLRGVVMELEDCAFGTLETLEIGSDPHKLFEGADWILLVGSVPRKEGMERADLLSINAKTFVEQGSALNQNPHAKVLVVGNPCNTNALVLSSSAPDVERQNIRAMSRLDENRTRAALARKAEVPITDVTHIAVWGNHSPSMAIDYQHALIRDRAAEEVIVDLAWLSEALVCGVQQRGAEVLKARGASSAASAAQAVIDSVQDWNIEESPDWYNASVYSTDNPYGIDKDLFFSFPLQSGLIVPSLDWSPELEAQIHKTEAELVQERDAVRSFL